MKGPLINAFKGINEFAKDGAIPMYGITNIYASQLAIVTRKDAAINSVIDLRGKKVSVGPPGSGTEVDAKMVLEAAGITYQDLTAQFLGWTDSAEALADKSIDAFFLARAGQPHPGETTRSRGRLHSGGVLQRSGRARSDRRDRQLAGGPRGLQQ